MPAIVPLVYLAILLLALAALYILTTSSKALNDLLSIKVKYIGTLALGSFFLGPLIKLLDGWQKQVSKQVAATWGALTDSFSKSVLLARIVSNGLHSAIDYLWNSKLADALAGPLGLIAGGAHAAYSLAHSVYDDLHNPAVQVPDKILSAINGATGNAVTRAASYTDHQISAVQGAISTTAQSIEGDIDRAVTTAERYTDSAVAGLKSAEDAAVASVKSLAGAAEGDAQKALSAAAGALSTAEAYTDTQLRSAVSTLDAAISSAEQTAQTEAASALSAARSTLQAGIDAAQQAASDALTAAGGALTTAEGYADQAVATAKADLSALVGKTVSDAVADVTAQIGTALSTAEGDIAGVLSQALSAVSDLDAAVQRQIAAAEALASQAIAATSGAAATALEAVKAIAVGAEDELETLTGTLGVTGTAALIASIPALATLVHALATESGLENESCRTKVKGICQTDPLRWAALLAAIGAVGLETMDFSQMVGYARGLVSEGVDLVEKVAA